jgi:hypothetical protein
MRKKLSPLLLLLLCSSCTQFSRGEASRTPTVKLAASSPGKPPQLPNLAMVMTANTVEIQNDWNGYSDITPILRHAKLQLQNGELVGNSHIAVGGYGAAGIHQQVTTKVKIPAAVTAQFLELLAKTPVKTGVYTPKIVRADDYPKIAIVIKSTQQQTIFSSESQGVNNLPWKVTIGKVDPRQNYITNSHLPAQALKLLDPYLANPGIDGIIKRRHS